MPRDLFGDVTRPSISIGNRKWYTVPVSLFSHSLIVGMFLVLPILAAPFMPDVLASRMEYVDIMVPPVPPAPRPPVPKTQPVENPRTKLNRVPGLEKQSCFPANLREVKADALLDKSSFSFGDVESETQTHSREQS